MYDWSGWQATAAAVAIFSLLPLFLMLRGMIRGTDTARLQRSDIHWVANYVVTDDTERQVYTGYLRRHHFARAIGGLLGAAFAVLVDLRWATYSYYCHYDIDTTHCSDSTTSQFSVGFIADPMMGDLLVGTLTGILVATLLTESYRLTPDRGPRRAALLLVRPARPLPAVVLNARLMAIPAILGGTANAIFSGEPFNAGGAYLALLLCGIAELTQRAITDRRRPTDDRAAAVDERLRDFAGRSVAWLELAGSALALGWTLSRLVYSASVTSGGPLEVVIGLLKWALLALAMVATHKSSGWPPLGWVVPQPPATSEAADE
jgi:hypothetical protein